MEKSLGLINGVTEQKRCSGGIEKMKKYADNARFQRACLLPAAYTPLVKSVVLSLSW